MKERKEGLTELEGAAMGEVYRRRACTAYQLRRVFSDSPSTEWSGSAGAIYPVLRRLHAAGWLAEEATADGRGTVLYSLTAAGRAALNDWLCDVERAIGPGLDPFRTRAALWAELPPSRRTRCINALIRAVEARSAAIKQEMKAANEADRKTIGLEFELQALRLRWLRAASRDA